MWDRLKEQMRKAGIERELSDELRSGIALQEVLAVERQKRIAAANRRNPRRGVDGIGATRLCMDPFFRALADVQFGPGWIKDKAAVKDLLSKHPEFAVPYAKSTTVAVQGLKGRKGQK